MRSYTRIISFKKSQNLLHRGFIVIEGIWLLFWGLQAAELSADVNDECRWRLWETKRVGDKFEGLVTDLIHRENHRLNEKSHQHNDSATNILNRSSSKSHKHNDVTNINVTMFDIDTVTNINNPYRNLLGNQTWLIQELVKWNISAAFAVVWTSN